MAFQSLLFEGQPIGLELCVRNQSRTAIASAELHDICFKSPQYVDSSRRHSFIDLALNRRAGDPRGFYPDVRGHRDRAIGDVIFVPANMRLKSAWNSGTQRSVCVQFDGTEDAGRDWTLAELDSTLDLRNGFLHDAMMRLARELEQPGFQSSLMIETLCIQIAIALARHFESARADVQRAGQRFSAVQMRRIEAMIEAGGPLPSVAELAGDCGISARHFCRMFRTTTGRSLTDFAAERRLARARILLADLRRPIKQIAWECGFRTPAAFSAAFRSATGYQPRAYRSAIAL